MLAWGGGPAKLVEGKIPTVAHFPSTALRAVPLPIYDGEELVFGHLPFRARLA